MMFRHRTEDKDDIKILNATYSMCDGCIADHCSHICRYSLRHMLLLKHGSIILQVNLRFVSRICNSNDRRYVMEFDLGFMLSAD